MTFNQFVDQVFRAEGLEDWSYRIWQDRGLCLHDKKELRFKHDDFATVLHEVAHAILPEVKPKDCHDVLFADTLTKLIRKYTIPFVKSSGNDVVET